jgi:hypothetical protein
MVGSGVGSGVGSMVGSGVGSGVGSMVGSGVGSGVGSMVAETGAVDGASLATSVGLGVASSGRQAMTISAPTATSADHFANRELRVRVLSKACALLPCAICQKASPGPLSADAGDVNVRLH